jgi:hypothetical protein
MRIFVLMGLFLTSVAALAETDSSLMEKIEVLNQRRSSRYAMDFNINSFSNNYGLGVGVSSPYILNNSLNFRLSGAYAWVQGVANTETTQTWAPYGLVRLGVYGSGFVYGTAIRAYGGGGPMLVIPSTTLSDQNTKVGGFGLVGLEFPLGGKSGAMFLELGGMGSGAKATKLSQSPIYANGFLASWGFRYVL